MHLSFTLAAAILASTTSILMLAACGSEGDEPSFESALWQAVGSGTAPSVAEVGDLLMQQPVYGPAWKMGRARFGRAFAVEPGSLRIVRLRLDAEDSADEVATTSRSFVAFACGDYFMYSVPTREDLRQGYVIVSRAADLLVAEVGRGFTIRFVRAH